jgi:ADP-ribose pyrophosphatase YjhB (NUDIX family)
MNYNKNEKNYISNYNENNDNDFFNEKIIISNQNYYCSNCNRRGHLYNKCSEPIISNGIISLYIEDFDLSLVPLLENYISENIKNTKININKKINNIFDKKVKFLMVQRKHSLGYIEFMRGRYKTKDINKIKYLFEQMTPKEIEQIRNYDFDHLWNILWNNVSTVNSIIKKKHYKEYIISKEKFYELKMYNSYLFTHTTPVYKFNEWGFPKGRREIYESDVVCAMREFEEETNYNENEYSLLGETSIIKENLVGTDGVNYRHNYYVAILHSNKIFQKENKEIGDVKIMNIDKCISLIRPYHYEKQTIVKKIYTLVINFLIENSIINKKKIFSTSI